MNLEVIKKLRDLTGAGIGDINKALTEANGDEQKAIDILRLQGEKMAAKKADRATKEGQIAMVINNDFGVLTAVACETDFVSRNPEFKAMVQKVGEAVASLTEKVDVVSVGQNNNIKPLIEEIVAKMGENTMIKEVKEVNVPGAVVAGYVHTNGKIGALVALIGEANKAGEVGRDVAMHLAAMRPAYVKTQDVPAEVVDHEKEIYQQQLLDEGKPADMVEKIMPGKLKKFYTEVCLLEQPFIKDDKVSVGQYISANGCEYKDSVFVVL
jgi:elongation factor Ts